MEDDRIDYERDDTPAETGLAVAWLFFWLVIGLGWLLLMVIASTRAGAHEAPLGWTYPFMCCSNKDCREAQPGDVRETANGYVVTKSGEMVPYGDRRIKDSPDGRFHLCQQGGDIDKGRVLCLFAPARGF